MNTCDSCKHWNAPVEITSYGKHVPMISITGSCACPMVNGDAKLLSFFPDGKHRFYRDLVMRKGGDQAWISKGNNIEWEENHTIPLDVAYPDASDNYNIIFYCGPKFGCIHHEEIGLKECNCPDNRCYEEDLDPGYKCRHLNA